MDFFGLDIGSQNIKIVQLKPNGQNYELKTIGNGPSTGKGILSESEADLTSLAVAVKKLYSDLKVTTRNVVVALPEDQVVTRIITLPKLTDEELESALKWEAEQYVPFPLAEATLTYEILDGQKSPEGKMTVLLVAALNRLIDKTVKVVKAAGLVPVSIETEMLSMVRSLTDASKDIILFLDLGAKSVDIAITDNGRLCLTRSVATAGEALTRSISSELGLEFAQAEEYKRAYGINPANLNGKVAKAIEPAMEAVAKEVDQAVQFFQTANKGKMVKQIIASGGTSLLPHIVLWLTKRVGVETEIGDPFKKVVASDLLQKLPKESRCLYAIAVGLAMKEI